MLESKLPIKHAVLENSASPETSPIALIEALILFARRRYAIVGIVCFIALSIAILYLKVTPPTFTSSVELILGKPENQFIPRQGAATGPPMDTYNFESLIQIVKSDNVAYLVVKRLHLDTDPEFVGGGGGLLSTLFGIKRAGTPQTALERSQQAIVALEKNLDVARAGMSYVMEISYSAVNSEKSALIANTIASEFIAEQLDAKSKERRAAGDWLLERANQLREQTKTAERAVSEFKKNNNILTVNGGSLNEQQVFQLTAQLATARQKTSEALTRVNQIESATVSDPATNPIDATASIDSLASPALAKLRQRYSDLAAQQRDMARKFGENSGAVNNILNQKNDLRQPIQDELRRLGEAARGDYEAAKQRQEALDRDLAQAVGQSEATNRAQVALQELESVARSSRTLYDSFLQRSKESFQEETFPLSDARIISPAFPPQQKSRPKSMLVLILAGLGGLGLGVGIGLLRDLLDGAFRTGKQIEASLNMPCIALVPRITRTGSARMTSRGNRGRTPIASPDPSRVIQWGRDVFWAAVSEPASRYAEEIRSIKFALDMASAANGRRKIVGLTSGLPNEGKSSIAAALGLLTAQVGARVIVLDLDLRNPSLSRVLAPDAEFGLVDVLLGRSALDKAIWIEPTSNMAFLPVSRKSHLLHTTEILTSVAMKQLFNELHQKFEYVIVDLPPLIPVVDARATAEIVDNYFLVVEWGRTKTSVVLRALDSAPSLNERFLGAILNKSDISKMGLYESHSKTYYNNVDFKRYGYTN